MAPGAKPPLRPVGSVAILLLRWVVLMHQAARREDGEGPGASRNVRFHIVFNNVPYKAGLTTGWGFACLVEAPDRTVLFDTGADGEVLLSNMQHLDLDPKRVDAVALSHIHGDHTGGLSAFLARNPHVTVYMPQSFPAHFQQEVADSGARVAPVSGPMELLPGFHSTGEMGTGINEQGLIVDSRAGLVLLTGCAHPDVTDMAWQARSYRGEEIELLMGGFHLGGRGEAELRSVIERLRRLGVHRVAPSHCTGSRALEQFREEWGDRFVEGGLGATIALEGEGG